MRPKPAGRSRFSIPFLAEIVSDLLILAGCTAIARAAWLTDPRLGLMVGGLILLGLAYVVTPRGA